MIVVEGPDGAGKTTLINTLSERTGLRVAPRVVSKDAEAMVDLMKWTEKNVAAGFQATIFDRHRLISEPIYGPVLRTEDQPGFDDPAWFSEMLRKFYDCGSIVIYCLPPFEQVWKNIENDPENSVVARYATARAIYGAYFNKAHTEYALRPRTYLFDYTMEESQGFILNHLVGRIMDAVDRNRRH